MENILENFTKKNKSIRYINYKTGCARHNRGKIDFGPWSYDKEKALIAYGVLRHTYEDYLHCHYCIIEDYERIEDKLQLLIDIFINEKTLNIGSEIETIRKGRTLSLDTITELARMLEQSYWSPSCSYPLECCDKKYVIRHYYDDTEEGATCRRYLEDFFAYGLFNPKNLIESWEL